jgi:hypothetical protein
MGGQRYQHRRLLVITSIFLFLFPVLLLMFSGTDLKFSIEYPSFFLDNAQFFFGKLEDVGSPDRPSRNGFYVQWQLDPKEQTVKNLPVNKGIEWHGPDFMRPNAQHVMFIEPVVPHFRTAQLFREAKTSVTAAAKKEQRAPPGK